MTRNLEIKSHQDPDGPNRPSGSFKSWLKLAAWVGGLVFFIYVLGPLGLNLPYFKPIAKLIEEENINANAYYYTEVEEFSQAESSIRASLSYAPKAH